MRIVPAPAPGRAPVTGYVVNRELPSGGFERLGVTESLSYVHPNLSPGMRYVFTVRASSEAGPSQASASAFVDAAPTVALLPPAPPGNFTAEPTPNNDALLQWTAPVPSADRAPFTHFEIWHERSGTTGPRKVGESRSLSYIHPNLERGETHVFYVVAVSGVGASGPSRSATIDVPLEPTGILPPSAPGGFTAELTPNNDVQFNWTEPERAANRAPVEGYLVYEVQSGGGVRILNLDSDSDSDSDPVDALTYLHSPASPLAPGQRYTYFVRATSAVGTSPPSASDFVEVLADPLVPLAIPHVTVRADQGDGTTVTVSWVHNLVPQLQSLVKGFELQYCEVAPDHATDHCAGDWQPPPTSPMDAILFPPTTRIHTEDINNCVSSEDARMYRGRAVANNDTLSSRYSVPTRPICPSIAHSPPRRVDAVFAAAPVANMVNICW